ncbi:protein of unknown function [Acidovorax soli]|uniref:DUF945 domain-containing protein n=1 Tax=Acidovorax soli TaxID=592050 RepID=A0A1H4DH22_9BURK|nr:protein of unknown function [Acidovorax soli]
MLCLARDQLRIGNKILKEQADATNNSRRRIVARPHLRNNFIRGDRCGKLCLLTLYRVHDLPDFFILFGQIRFQFGALAGDDAHFLVECCQLVEEHFRDRRLQSYQMLAGMFRFVCSNGLVCGDTVADVRVPHKGDVAGHVIEGAYEVLSGFDRVKESRDAMHAITLNDGESEVFARAALALKYDDPGKPAPITESQILMPRRFDDRRPDLWSVFNRTQENLTQGGLRGRSANGRRQQTRPVQGIDQNIRLNRALWLLADGMRQLKA